jgi:hypothetical protein
MAKNRGIRLRISAQRVQALLEICDEMVEDFRPANDHQHLLGEYLHELKHKLAEMTRKNQEMYMLHLVGTESIAFYQLWNMLDISTDKYAVIIVNDLLKKVSSLAA